MSNSKSILIGCRVACALFFEFDVSDGILANSVSSGPHSVPDKAPARAIHHPTPGMQFVEGAKVRLFGTALDLEDGKLASKRINMGF